jgi:hypothetical protein
VRPPFFCVLCVHSSQVYSRTALTESVLATTGPLAHTIASAWEEDNDSQNDGSLSRLSICGIGGRSRPHTNESNGSAPCCRPRARTRSEDRNKGS